MATSDVKICNRALAKVGGGRIDSLTEGTEAARVCNELYSELRDEVLVAGQWDFAVKRVGLAQNATAPTSRFTYAYNYPADYLKTVSVTTDGTTPLGPEDFRSEGSRVVTDQTAICLVYMARITDSALYPPDFASSLAARIAIDLASSIAKNGRLRIEMQSEYAAYLNEHLASNSGNETLQTPQNSGYENGRA